MPAKRNKKRLTIGLCFCSYCYMKLGYQEIYISKFNVLGISGRVFLNLDNMNICRLQLSEFSSQHELKSMHLHVIKVEKQRSSITKRNRVKNGCGLNINMSDQLQ